MNKGRVFIIHGWEGNPGESWLPWLKENVEKAKPGVQAIVPSMPDSYHPVMEKWLAEMRARIGTPDEKTFLVGHSLGTIAILRYLESLPENIKVGGAISVAGFGEPVGIQELESFFKTPLDFEKVRASAKDFVVIDSDNDPYVAQKYGDALEQKLGAKRITLKNAGHINSESGFVTLPEALQELLKRLDL
jgi:predicted alpha/beta hydrolase family esterase